MWNRAMGPVVVDMGAYEHVDSDNDGVPDYTDICPGFDDNQDGDSDGVRNGQVTVTGRTSSSHPLTDGNLSG